MEIFRTADELILALAAQFRVINLGGIAVIAHGLDRNTYDADIWLEPFSSPDQWSQQLNGYVYGSPGVHPVAIGVWEAIPFEELPTVIREDGVIRIKGLDRPLDIFRKPNELEADQFDDVWSRASPMRDGTRLPDAIDLLVTKMATGREKDLQDIAFLEVKVERDYLQRLPRATAEEAEFMLGRFLSPKVAEAALDHPDPPVRDLALKFLREMEADGNPFARDILQRLNLT